MTVTPGKSPEEILITITDSYIKKMASLEEIRAFFEEEKKFYEFLVQATRIDGNLSSSINSYTRPLDHIMSFLNQAENNRSNHSHVTSMLEQLRTTADAAYKNKYFIYSLSNEGSFLKEVSLISPQAAAYVYSCFTNQQQNVNWNNHHATRGYIEFVLHTRGINPNSASAGEKAFDLLKEKTLAHMESQRTNADNLEKSFSNHSKNIEELLTSKRIEFTQRLGEQTSVFEKFHNESLEKLENVNKAYKEFMTLKAPVEYWGDLKVNSYYRALFASILAILYTYFAGDFVIRKTNESKLLSDESVSYGKIIFFVVMASAFIWILRIMFKYLLGQLHVANEATEKMVMTKTYLALLEDGKLEKTERELVLKSVFRPSGSGLLTEEHPHPAMEIINKIQKPG